MTREAILRELLKATEGRRNINGLTYDTTIPGTLIDALLAELQKV